MDVQKKAVVIGGSNGIGLAISRQLMNSGYFVNILDICAPGESDFGNHSNCAYYFCNMLELDLDLLEALSKDPQVEVLMITAGIGRVADFEYLHTAEIDKTMIIDVVSAIKIIRIFYDRIKNEKPFYCGIMGSIAGFVSSPMFSVYAAAKAGVCRFVESVNIELEAAGVTNRILNVSPGSIKGTRFNGGSNDLSMTEDLACQITTRLLNSETLYIPEYENIYKGVMDRYHADAHEYGLHSYRYKLQSGRVQNQKQVKIGYLSGTFDLFHMGHVNLLERAKAQCDYLIVGVHPDASHKGKETFIPFEERKTVVGACKYVDKVVDSCPEDSDAWELWHYNRLFVGSDYKGTERFNRYEKILGAKGVQIVYFPYTQGTSSTQIRNTIVKQADK